MNTETDERVAIKVLDKEKIQKQNMGAQIKKEISIMKMVRHKHVVVLREVLASRTKVRHPLGAMLLLLVSFYRTHIHTGPHLIHNECM